MQKEIQTKNLKKNSSRLIIAIVLMVIVNWIGYRFMYEDATAKQFLDGRRLLKHILNFSWLLIIYLIGYYGWYSYKYIWVKKTWTVIYGFVVIIMIVLGMVDLLIGSFKLDMKDAIGLCRFFFESPMPFSLLWFVCSRNDNKKGKIF